MLGEGKGSNQDLEIWEGKSPPLHYKNWFDSQLSCRVLPKARAAPQQQDNPLCPCGYVLPEGFPGAIGCHSALSFGGVEQTKAKPGLALLHLYLDVLVVSLPSSQAVTQST